MEDLAQTQAPLRSPSSAEADHFTKHDKTQYVNLADLDKKWGVRLKMTQDFFGNLGKPPVFVVTNGDKTPRLWSHTDLSTSRTAGLVGTIPQGPNRLTRHWGNRWFLDMSGGYD